MEDEKTLIARIAQNDSAAENDLYLQYCEKVRLIVQLRVSNTEDREDLVQDILVAVIVSLREQKFDASRGSTLAHYIHGIIRNTINQYFKDKYKWKQRLDGVRSELLAEVGTITDDLEFERKEEQQHREENWKKLIATLKPEYREVLFLRFYAGLAVREISEQLNVPAQKVSDRLKYAKQLLLRKKQPSGKILSILWLFFLIR